MKNKSIKRIIISAYAIAFLAASVYIQPHSSYAAAKVKSVKVAAPYKKTATVVKGKKIKLSAEVSVTPDKKANKKVKYKSGNSSIASVSSKGIVKGKKTGSTKITVTSKANSKKKAVVKVKVVAKAVKKVSLNVKKASIKVGETIKIKASTLPKTGVCKDVIWTSSNKKAATVDANGVVTAVGAGSAKIKATAADGSKTAALCQVMVTNPVSIAYATVADKNIISVKLNRADALNIDSVNIMAKENAEGKYTRSYTVKGVTTANNIDYNIMVSPNDIFYYGEYIKLTVNTSTGPCTKEIKAYFNNNSLIEDEAVIEGRTGEKIDKVQLIYGYRCIGEATYEAVNLPKGFYLKEINGYAYICGKSDDVLDNVIAQVIATDEFGNKITKNIRFLIGSKDRLVTYVEPIIAPAQVDSVFSAAIYAGGGSGKYSYEPGGQYEGIKLWFDQSFDVLYFQNIDTSTLKPGSLPQGNYSIKFNIKDTENPVSAEASANVTLTAGATVTGVLKDASGQPIVGRYVTAECISNAAVGTLTSMYPTDKEGKYTLRVVENETYDISSCYGISLRNKITANTTVDLISPCYKVSVWFSDDYNVYNRKVFEEYQNDANGTTGYMVDWTDVTDTGEEDFGIVYTMRNNELYLLPGTYSFVTQDNLTIADNVGKVFSTARAKFEVTVTNAGVKADAVWLPAKN